MEDLFLADLRHYKRSKTTDCWPGPPAHDVPLYCPPVETCDVPALLEMLLKFFDKSDRCVREISAVIEWLTVPSHHDFADVEVGDSVMTPADARIMVDNGIIRPTSPSPVTVRAIMRKELKRADWRKRPLMHTHAGNDGAHTFVKSMMRVNSIETLKRMARRNKFGATRDFKSFFHQLMLSLEVGQRYVLRINGEYFALTRAAMGHKASAAAAHSITRAVARLAAAGEAEFDVIIDDVAFFANDKDQLARVMARFDDICDEIGLTIGSKTDPATTVSHRGIDFDLSSQRVRVRETTSSRTRDRVAIYQARPTHARARSLLGAAVAAAQVVPIPVCSLMHRVARYIRGGPVADMADLSDLLLHDAPNYPTRYDALPFAGAIVADATPVSYGGVYVDQYGNVDYVAGSFAPGQFASVNEAEAWATILTLRLVPPRRLWARIEVFTDNQVWDRVMGKDWARAERVDVIRQELGRRLTAMKLVAGNSWVASADNPTDNISRQRDWTSEDTAKLRRLLGFYDAPPAVPALRAPKPRIATTSYSRRP